MNLVLSDVITKIARQEDVPLAQLQVCSQKLLVKRHRADAAKVQRLVRILLDQPTMTVMSPLIRQCKPKHRENLIAILKKEKASLAKEGPDGKKRITKKSPCSVGTKKAKGDSSTKKGIGKLFEDISHIAETVSLLHRIAGTKEAQALMKRIEEISTSEEIKILSAKAVDSEEGKALLKELEALQELPSSLSSSPTKACLTLATKRDKLPDTEKVKELAMKTFFGSIKGDEKLQAYVRTTLKQTEAEIQAFEKILKREEETLKKKKGTETNAYVIEKIQEVRTLLSILPELINSLNR